MTARPPGSLFGRHVVVVGGGLAGLSAALGCVDLGARVTMLERQRRLGGLTWSFSRHDVSMDNGQHVFLGCCETYLTFLDRIGAADGVIPARPLDVPVVAPGTGGPVIGRLRRQDLPVPFHLAGTLLRYPHISRRERLSLGRALAALYRLDLHDPGLDERTFGAWLMAHGQSEAAITAVWDLITIPTVNLPASEASLAVAAMVFKTGLLSSRQASDIGWSAVPLGRLHGEPAAASLRHAGADVQLGVRVNGVEREADGEWRVLTTDGPLSADAVVLATPHEEAATIVPPSVQGRDRWSGLGSSAIVDVHLVFDRPVTRWPVMAALRSPVQWVFDRTSTSGLTHSGSQYLAISLSAADHLLGCPPDELVRDTVAALAQLLPPTSEAVLVDSTVTKERRATFRAVPGTQALRPSAATSHPGLVLAGAWTDTGWPATMEGAVRSGRVCGPGPCCHHEDEPVASPHPTSTPRGGGVMPITRVDEILACSRKAILPAMREAIDGLAPTIRPIATYHMGWTDPEGNELESAPGGKGIRPTLALLGAQAAHADLEVGIPGGVAVELVHNYSLIHDDIIDIDTERHHRPTVWSVFGIAPAIVAGDALQVLAHLVLLDGSELGGASASASLANATAEMIAGQSHDIDFETRRDVSVDECMAMSAAKTGALLGCASSIGAILAGAPLTTVNALHDYGLHLGLAFQAVDDLLGIWGDPSTTGKPAGSDLRQRKKSMPLVCALAAEGAEADELRSLVFGDSTGHPQAPMEAADVARATYLVESCGGREWTTAQAKTNLDAALGALERVPLAAGPQRDLADLAVFVVERES